MKRTVIFALAVCLFAACNQKGSIIDDSIAGLRVFEAGTESSRTSLSGLNVCWDAGDEISIFDKSTANLEYVYAGEAGATKGNFVAAAASSASGTELPLVYAAYPYDEYNEILEDGTMSLWFSPEQEFKSGSFAPGANVMVAVSETNSLAFKNVCGYLKIRLYGDSSSPVYYVGIEGNKGEIIGGEALVALNSDGKPVVQFVDDEDITYSYALVFDESASVTLPEKSSMCVDFWLALPPCTFEEGITIYVASADNKEFEITNTKPLEIKPGVCTSTAPIEVTFSESGELESVYGYYIVNSSSIYEDYGSYEELIYISAAPEGAEGNLHIEGFLAELPFDVYATYSNGVIYFPSGLIYSGELFQDDPTSYDVLLYFYQGNIIYGDAIPLDVTGDHQIEYGVERYNLGFFIVEEGTYYLIDGLVGSSIVFTYYDPSNLMGRRLMSSPNRKEHVRALSRLSCTAEPIKSSFNLKVQKVERRRAK